MSQSVINLAILTPYVGGNYFGKLIHSVQSVTQNEDVRLFVIRTITHKRPSESCSYDYNLSFKHIDGWIVFPQSIAPEYLHKLVETGKPIVQISREIYHEQCIYVMPDNYQCVKEAVKHFYKHGHQKIAFVGCFDLADVRERFHGYQDGLRELGLEYNPDWVYKVSAPLSTGGHEAVKQMLKNKIPFTGIITGTDSNAVGVMDKLIEAGYKIPEDIAVMGFDDMDFAKYTMPPLSSIHQNISGLAVTAAKTLIKQIRANQNVPETSYVKSELILRQSCGCNDSNTPNMSNEYHIKTNFNVKIINYLGGVLLNNFLIGNELNRSNYDELTSMTWLQFTNFLWACTGLWSNDSSSKELVIEQFFTANPGSPSPLGIQSTVEEFPPLDYLPDSTYLGDDIVWLYPITTEKKEWGFLVLSGPMDQMKLYEDFDTMSDRYDLLAYALEREALSDKYRNLLNNVGQGFLSFGKDLIIENEYSPECKKIFGKNLEKMYFPEVIYPNDVNEKGYLQNLLLDILNESVRKKTDLLISLLPEILLLNSKHIRIEYKLIEDSSIKRNKKMILILTDITDRVKLENKVERERNTLKMVVKTMVQYNEFIDLINDYKYFCTHLIRDMLGSFKPHLEIISDVLRDIHTFKGNFSQMELTGISGNLDDLETTIIDMKNNNLFTTATHFREFISGINLVDLLTPELNVLKDILGENFFNKDNKVFITEDQIKEIEKKVVSSLSPAETRILLPEIRKLRYKPFSSLIAHYPNYISRLSEKLNKSVYNVVISGGDDIYIDDEKYHDFAKSLVHVFRNAVDHGIETPEKRLSNGKDEFGNITCEVSLQAGQIHLTITDDGNGIDIEKIRQKLIANNICDLSSSKKLNDSDLIQYIFKDNFSTKEVVTDISGRGFGLSAVQNEVMKLGGKIDVDYIPDGGTKFIFRLPYKDIYDID